MTHLSAPHVRTRRIVENSRISGAGRGLNAHRMVAETAVAMARELYGPYMAADNAMYRKMRENLTERQAMAAFVARIAPLMLEEARLALTDLLSQPDTEVSPLLKERIAEALVKDTDFRANRVKAAQHMPSGLIH